MRPTKAYISLWLVDELADVFVPVGGAGFTSMAKAKSEFDSLPLVADDEYTAFVAELCDSDGSILDTRDISGETVAAKMGEPLDALISRGRAKLAEEASRKEAATESGVAESKPR
jgi:hypothetical protein